MLSARTPKALYVFDPQFTEREQSTIDLKIQCNFTIVARAQCVILNESYLVTF